MERKPITPALHGLIDYGFGVVNLAVPALLGLTGAARVISAAWAAAQGTLNAFTDHRPPTTDTPSAGSFHSPLTAGRSRSGCPHWR